MKKVSRFYFSYELLINNKNKLNLTEVSYASFNGWNDLKWNTVEMTVIP